MAERVELRWPGDDPSPEPTAATLIELPLGLGDRETPNRVVHGDNLAVLAALTDELAGRVKCVYIDPPYNTGSSFTHYRDDREHAAWLTFLRDRIERLWGLLTDDGSLWISIDDRECHYLKVLCDQLLGRDRFVASVIWEKDAGRKNDTHISTSHDYVLVYAREGRAWKATRNLLPRSDAQRGRYKNPDDDPRGPWRQGADGTAKSGSAGMRYPITLPSGRVVEPPSGNFWRFSRETLERARAEGRVYFGRDGDRLPVIKKYLSEVQPGVVPKTWWPSAEVGSNQEARRDHLRKLLPDREPFVTPKPERLLQRILHVATDPGDWVLDAFAGSGTTGAVAHKMGRRWVLIERGDHCLDYLVPRLRKVIEGDDPYGITEEVAWGGGGGFRVFRAE